MNQLEWQEYGYRLNWVALCYKRAVNHTTLAKRKTWERHLHNAQLKLNQFRQRHWMCHSKQPLTMHKRKHTYTYHVGRPSWHQAQAGQTSGSTLTVTHTVTEHLQFLANYKARGEEVRWVTMKADELETTDAKPW